MELSLVPKLAVTIGTACLLGSDSPCWELVEAHKSWLSPYPDLRNQLRFVIQQV